MAGHHTFDKNDNHHGIADDFGLDDDYDDSFDDDDLDDDDSDRRSSSDPNWSVVVGSPRPQPKERPAVAGPCLICLFLLLRYTFTFHFNTSTFHFKTFIFHLKLSLFNSKCLL